MTDDDFRRLEGKVDKLSDAVTKLVLVEERQTNQAERIGKVEQKIASLDTAHTKLDRTVHMWINRGVGVWALAVAIFSILQFGVKVIK